MMYQMRNRVTNVVQSHKWDMSSINYTCFDYSNLFYWTPENWIRENIEQIL